MLSNKEITLQRRAEKLVANEVFCHIGGLIEELDTYTSGQWSLDNIYQDHEPTDDEVLERMQENGWKKPAELPEEWRNTSEYEAAYDELRDEFEPLEYWAVSEWLADKLRAEGEVVAEVGLTNIWARQTSGQGISIDYVIEKITEATEYAKSLEQ